MFCCAPKADENEVQDDLSRIHNHFDLIEKAKKEAIDDEDVKLAKTTWAQAGSDPEKFGVLLFRHIFGMSPEALAHFKFKNEPNVRNYNSPGLKAQGVSIAEAMGKAVDSVNDLGAVLPVVDELASLLAPGDIEIKAHLVLVGKALFLTLGDLLKGNFNDRVQFTWAKFWCILSKTMVLSTPPPKPKQPENPLTEEEVALIQGSWKKAGDKLGESLYKNIFEISPEALQLFPFRDEPKPLACAALKVQAKEVVQAIGANVDGLGDVYALLPDLKGRGKTLAGCGVTPPHYDIMGQALIKTLASSDKEFTTETEAAWNKAWGVVARTMKGTNYP